MGYRNFLEFKAQYARDQKAARNAEIRKRNARITAIEGYLAATVKAFMILLVIGAAAFGVALYIR